MRRRVKRALRLGARGLLWLLLLNLLLMTASHISLRRWEASPLPPPEGTEARIAGVHAHTAWSDGSGTPEEVITSAKAAGLDILVLTDHNVLVPDSALPAVDGISVLRGAELSLGDGHLLAYGLDLLPVPFSEAAAGGLDSLLAQIRARAGFALVAHPLHPKIRWRADTLAARIDGMEIINADVAWRDDSALELINTLLGLPFFKDALNLLLDRPDKTLVRWDWLMRTGRRIAGVGAVDAHANIKLGSLGNLAFPSYEATFALVQNQVYLENGRTGIDDIALAIRRGHLLFGFAGLGRLDAVQIRAVQGGQTFLPGSLIDPAAGPIRIEIVSPADWSCEIRLIRNGITAETSLEPHVLWQLEMPGIYRIEVYQLRRLPPFFGRAPVAWAFSNPFYVGTQD